MNKIKVALIQMHVEEDKDKNLQTARKFVIRLLMMVVI